MMADFNIGNTKWKTNLGERRILNCFSIPDGAHCFECFINLLPVSVFLMSGKLEIPDIFLNISLIWADYFIKFSIFH
jgi:hypothetical protein